jgi:hypothetical protein
MSDITLPTWRCPICKKQPDGDNFRIQLIETRSGLPLIKWLRGDKREGLFCVPEGQPISNAEDLLGHITTFEGCLSCFSDECEKNPLAKSLFKLFWFVAEKYKIPLPQHGGNWIHSKF